MTIKYVNFYSFGLLLNICPPPHQSITYMCVQYIYQKRQRCNRALMQVLYIFVFIQCNSNKIEEILLKINFHILKCNSNFSNFNFLALTLQCCYKCCHEQLFMHEVEKLDCVKNIPNFSTCCIQPFLQPADKSGLY